jgi:hypothetical protein
MDLEGMADGVRFYQSQAFFKEPGDMGSAFHTDNYACPLDTSNQLTTAWLPLVETDREMGMLAFARGSHADMNIQFWNNGTTVALSFTALIWLQTVSLTALAASCL